jgi:hypothetical protein
MQYPTFLLQSLYDFFAIHECVSYTRADILARSVFLKAITTNFSRARLWRVGWKFLLDYSSVQ